MIAIHFHHELYDGFAIDEAVKVYAPFVSAELSREPAAFLVKLTARAEAIEQGLDEETISAELANYALGKTIERGGAG